MIEQLLGQPYERTGRHCWWLACLVQREVYGRALPLGPETMPSPAGRARLFHGHPARAGWIEHPAPADGTLVLMGRAPGLHIHCGVYLADRGGVIHTDLGHGVVIETLVELRTRGWHPSFYRPA